MLTCAPAVVFTDVFPTVQVYCDPCCPLIVYHTLVDFMSVTLMSTDFEKNK